MIAAVLEAVAWTYLLGNTALLAAAIVTTVVGVRRADAKALQVAAVLHRLASETYDFVWVGWLVLATARAMEGDWLLALIDCVLAAIAYKLRDKDTDDRWKRRRARAKEKVVALASGRLVSAPA